MRRSFLDKLKDPDKYQDWYRIQRLVLIAEAAEKLMLVMAENSGEGEAYTLAVRQAWQALNDQLTDAV